MNNTSKTTFFRGPARRMLLLTLLVMALRWPLGYAVSLIPGAEDPAVRYAFLILQSAVLWGLPALLMRPWRCDALPDDRKCGGACVAALLLGALAQMALSPVTAWWADTLGLNLSVSALPDNTVQWLLAALALCVMPALCEEAFFRGSVLTGLSLSAGKGATLITTSLLFALMHGSLAGLPAQMAVSLLATLMMLRWGKLRVSILFHLGYNAMSLLPVTLPLNLMTSASLGLLLTAAALGMTGHIRWHSRRRLCLADALLCLCALLCAASAYLPELITLITYRW